MTEYRKKMFRGAKIEDCILDFISMEKELNKMNRNTGEDEKQFLLGMSQAYRFVVNRLTREFDYVKGGDVVKLKVEELIRTFRKSATATQEQSKTGVVNLVEGKYYNEIPEEAKKELLEIPEDLQVGLYEGMSHGYEKIIIDLELLLESTQTDKFASIEEMMLKYKKTAAVLKEKINEDETDYRSGYLQGEMSSYLLAVEELQGSFELGN
ncbi:hypothetical protein [Alkalihalobacterium bogoriense]|uniref:hypothetical protein n=1 Tax=Alkalihalobacterium bogoriense TaxID=246272 RepID=UPI00054FC769|nr:hypothetical protein [Alkalihalobacterium bogoriense]